MKNVQQVLLSWYFADRLLKIYYSDFLITSCHSSVTVPLGALELKSMQSDLKVSVSEVAQRAAPVWIGPLTLLILQPHSSFKYKRALSDPFFTAQRWTFEPDSTWGLLFLDPVILWMVIALRGWENKKRRRGISRKGMLAFYLIYLRKLKRSQETWRFGSCSSGPKREEQTQM